MRSVQVITWFGISVGVLVCSVSAWLAYRKRLRKSRPRPSADEWQSLGTVKIINFYPIKGGAPIRLEQVKCSLYGLHTNGLWERCLVAYDEADAIVYAGSYPLMLSIRSVIVSERVMCLEAPNMPSILIDLNQMLQEPNQVLEKQKNGDCKRLVECGSEHHEWFSRAVLKRKCGLRLYVKLQPLQGEAADVFPVMVMHERSVHDLNARLSGRNKPVDCQQFRGNLVVDSNAGVQPYDEDNWQWLKIGNDTEHSTIMSYNSDCLRCILVNVNVDDYTRSADFEPLRTLKRYRLCKSIKEPSMGVYFDVYKFGSINIGDPVYVQCMNNL